MQVLACILHVFDFIYQEAISFQESLLDTKKSCGTFRISNPDFMPKLLALLGSSQELCASPYKGPHSRQEFNSLILLIRSALS